jgi:hypothetical protein
VTVHLGLRAAAAAGALWLLLALAACGPGVGGTGTGNGVAPGAVGLAQFGATPASVCAEPLGMVLGCVAVVGSGGSELPAPRLFTGPCAVAAFEGDEVELDVLCEGLYFGGQWGVDGQGRRRYFGLVGTDPLLQAPELATLELADGGGGSLLLTLRAAGGDRLAGPLLLSPTPP